MSSWTSTQTNQIANALSRKQSPPHIAYEIRERLVDRWLQPVDGEKAKALVGLQFEFVDIDRKKKPRLPYLRVRQVYSRPGNRLVLREVGKDKVRRRRHVYAAGSGAPTPDGDLPKKRLYERLEFCGEDVPDFVFFPTAQLTYLAERYGRLFLSGCEAGFGATFAEERDGGGDFPKRAMSLKLVGDQRIGGGSATRSAKSTQSSKRSADAALASAGTPGPETRYFLGTVCPPRWYIDY